MPGSSDDVPSRSRGAVPPPPSLAPDDAPAAVDVPRMEPPPPSLEAMITGAPPRLRKPEPAAPSWWIWLVAALLSAAVSAYLLR